MARPKELPTLRRRNISWSDETDRVVRILAAQKNMTVSELLDRLVNDESKRKIGRAVKNDRVAEVAR